MTRAVTAAAIVLALFAGAVWLGRDSADTAREVRDARDYIKTMEAADHAPNAVPADPDGRRQWLRDYPD